MSRMHTMKLKHKHSIACVFLLVAVPLFAKTAYLRTTTDANRWVDGGTVDAERWANTGNYVEIFTEKEFQTVMGWGGTIQSDPYQIWHSSQIEGRGSNRIGFSNAEADELIEKARRTLDVDERNQMYHRFQLEFYSG